MDTYDELVQFARDNNIDAASDSEYRAREICAAAARLGRIDILELMQKAKALALDRRAIYLAADSGHIALLKWFHESVFMISCALLQAQAI